MNSTATSQTARAVRECKVISLGTLDQTTTEAYGWLIFIAVINIITCPITTVLNALIIIAVKTKRRVKTMSNIALACLASTDAVMGVIGQPLFISWVIAELQGSTSSTYCVRIQLSKIALRALGIASLFHLAMVNAERYIAIKHSLQYETIVTEARLIGMSAILWIITLLWQFAIPAGLESVDKNVKIDTGITFSCIASILVCQVLLYCETRRHEKQIAAQQVSVVAREKFIKEKKALKQTTTVIFFLILCYLPLMISRILISTAVINSVNSAYIAYFTGVFSVMSNSLLNPILHCVRIKQFRLALKEIVFTKGNVQAANLN